MMLNTMSARIIQCSGWALQIWSCCSQSLKLVRHKTAASFPSSEPGFGALNTKYQLLSRSNTNL